MLGEELGNLGFHSLGQKGARPATQDFGELVGEHPWLNELDDGIFGHGVSSFGGEVAGLITATIRRLHSFTPSPTSAHSSTWKSPWKIENCGDRLWQILYEPRSMLQPEPEPETAP